MDSTEQFILHQLGNHFRSSGYQPTKEENDCIRQYDQSSIHWYYLKHE